MKLFACCFPEKKPVKSETKIPIGPKVPMKKGLHVALVVGHNKGSQGARNYLGESEWVFNSRIAKKLQIKLAASGILSTIILRPVGVSYTRQCRDVADRAESLGCTHAILMHFNDASGTTAMGCEVLIGKTATKEDNEWADVFTDMLNERYGFRERHNDGTKEIPTNHNGAGMVYRVGGKGIVTCLPEVCFAGYKNRESELIFEHEDKYVDVLHDSVFKAWTN